ncbi:hypothetical protein BRADI_1g27807v3 [Brachypodium distachyon]|uniref:MYND-type domain-containing protein n=1 Tax=Brachypodium distachyon TaxID=15368 RepID=A0A2K2DLF9_BRADI|nr:hypothetical protein BRADI_1g27807v3 [Brachypodium distachyon]PNT75117.1 hypothetical protein BRADI_1g27807v3 [Brachypodium distachyon]
MSSLSTAMECAAKGLVAEPCAGGAHRRCGSCGAVAYCSRAHQFIHWTLHKEECARLATQMSHIDVLSQFPFVFSIESPALNHAIPNTRCFFLESFKVHLKGLWKSECRCGPEISSVKDLSITAEWNMESSLCPCTEPGNSLSAPLASWEEYYRWRSLPLHSPAAVLLHWPLTLYHCLQLSRIQASRCDANDTLRIHYLGPEKELLQLPVFAELLALFPGVHLCIELVGPTVPRSRDGEVLNISSYAHCSAESCCCRSFAASEDVNCSALTLKLWKGVYHERYSDMDSNPHLIVAPNAGLAAYPTWLPTIVSLSLQLTSLFHILGL